MAFQDEKFLPRLLPAAYSALCVFLPVVGILFPRALAFAPGVVALVGIAAFRLMNGKFPALSRGALGLALGVFLLMVVSALWALDADGALSRAFKTLGVMLGGALFFSMARQEAMPGLKIFRRFFPVAVIIAGLICALDLSHGGRLHHVLHPDQAETGPENMFYLNRSAVVFILCLLPALFIARDEKAGWRRYLPGALLAVCAAALWQTNSQSAQLGFVLAAVFYFLFPYARQKAWTGLKILLCALLLAAPFLAQLMYQYLPPLAVEISWLQQGYAASRMEIWDFVARRALEQPFWGFGTEATRRITDFDTAQIYQRGTEILHPHNFALQIWIEFGLLGVIPAAGFFTWLIGRVRRAGENAARLFLPALFAGIAMAATSYGLWQGWWLGLFWLAAGYCALAVREAPTQEEE